MEAVDAKLIGDNLASARRFIEGVLGGKNPNEFDEIVSDDIRVTTVLKPQGTIEGKAEYVHVLGQTVSGQFTDRSLEIADIAPLMDGRVMARVRVEATHVGEVFGIAPTGRRILMHELYLMSFRDGKLVDLLVASLSPLHFEMLFASAISAMLFPSPAGDR